MSKLSLTNRNTYPTSLVVWCCHLDQEAITHAILQNTTQFQFRTGHPADDSDGCAEDKGAEAFR